MVLRRAVPFSLCILLSLLIAGCGAAPNTWHSIPVVNTQASGSVHGGQQPIAGAAIQLYTVGTTGDPSAATPLLTSAVTSAADGTFTITGLYSCTNATQVYIVATGGNPGLSTTNSDIALMAALGPCSALTSSTFISINELTTVAAVSALAPYMSSADPITAIGSSPSDASSLAAAFALANQLVNTATGTAPGNNVPTGYTVPVAQLNTLADILSACINSAGGTAGDGSLCGQLFALTTITPNPPPTNTIAALLNIVNDPTQNASALFALTPPTPPFQPTLTSAPPNWQIQLIPPPDNGTVTLTSSVKFTILGALQDLTLTNQGNTPLAIASITESDSGGPGAPYFTIAANNCGTTLPAQSSCTISVVSANSPQGGQPTTLTGTITVNDNATSGPQTASLSATDLYEIAVYDYPFYVTSTGIVSFSPTQVGSTATSPSAANLYYEPLFSADIAPPIPLTISGANPGDFSVAPPTPGGPQAAPCLGNYAYVSSPGPEQCTIAFTFKPTASGTRTARVSLDPSYGTPTGQYILLKGTGVGTGPSFSLSTNSLTLTNYLPGNIDPSSVGSYDIILTNSGSTTINIAASFTGTAAPYLSVSGSTCSSVAAGASCQFNVSFNAPTVGTYSGNLVLSDTNSTFTLSVPITSTTSYWRPVANPSFMSFGNQTTGTPSTASYFVIADPNGYPIGDAYTVSLQNSSSFVLTQGSTCSASTTQTCGLAIAFAPQAIGHVNEIATITDQSTGLQSQIALAGTGSGPTYTLSTTGIVFTPAATGGTTAATAITLTANGTQPVNISSISIPNAVNSNFAQANNCSSVAAGSSCTISVTFAPTAAGTQSATLQIASNAVNSPASVALTGTAATGGSGPILQFSPAVSLTFAPASPTQALTVTNSGSALVTISSATISGATGATFTITSNNCIGILSPGGSCSLSLTGIATSTTGSGSLVITSSTPNSPQSILLNATSSGGTGTTTTATLAPTSATFNIWGADEDFTLTNTNSGVLVPGTTATDTTHANTTEHQYVVTNSTCGGPLPSSGASCTYGLVSLPTLPIADYPIAFGVGTGDLYVNDSVGQQTASLVTDDGAYLWAPGQTSSSLSAGIVSGVFTLPNTRVGSSQSATFVLANEVTGSPAATLTIGGANPGDFAVSAVSPSVSPNPSSSCPVGAAPCTITVTFAPTALGTRTAKIALDPPSPATQYGQYLYVTGTAIASGPSFSTNATAGASLSSYLPSNIDPNSTGRQTITVTNTGDTTLNLVATLFGANPTNFTVDASQCHSVAPQATCPVNLTFSSTALGGYSATLFLSDTSSSASATVPLTGGTSYWRPTLTAYTGFGEFPIQKVNTLSSPLTFTVTDPNGYPLGDPVAITVTSNLILPHGNYCPAGSQPCTFVVQFDPQKLGSPLVDDLAVIDTVTGAGNGYVFYGTPSSQ